MKIFIIFICATLSSLAYGQTNSAVKSNGSAFFAQGMFSLESDELLETEKSLKENPNVKLVRLDVYSNRFFILTENIQALNQQELRSWFGPYGKSISCLQIGIHGLDEVASFPFINCNDN
ncbi:MAG: hypothetical protein KJ941_04855 [Bacteroidetes bacterium]|nr:hypothetical protein [Bacteroidota bacterium]